MTSHSGQTSDSRAVTVRYFAAARAAAGVSEEVVEVTGSTTLAALLDELRGRHQVSPKFASVLSVCSFLVVDRPVGAADLEDIAVSAGDSVDVLPPFAGG
jgi:sulfur-carrier protein